ncbi:MAG: glycoside hydrolase family 43 protein [Acidobacteria bacterium]|nr:glycoside hydrolase family 43 protein [Acidobacteriota bacterium]
MGIRRLAVAALASVLVAMTLVGTVLSTASPASAYPGAPWFRPGVPYTQNFPDPTVVRDGSTYWAYATSTGGSLMPAMSSTDLVTWIPRPAYAPNPYNSDPYFNDSFPVPPRWSKGGVSRTGKAQWGPGVAKFGSTWVAFTSWEVSDTRRCISMATAPSPAGPFTDSADAPFQCDVDPAGSIDPEPFIDVDGSAYLLWKSAGVPGSTPTRLWSRRLSPDGRSFAFLSSPQLLLATNPGTIINDIPQEDTWEGHGIENPSMVHHGGAYWLIYSANEWRSGDYRMGQARCAGPMGPCTRSSAVPLLDNTATELGPGGGSILTDAAGRLHLVHHSWNAPYTDYPPYPACTGSGTCTTQGQRRAHLLPLRVGDGALQIEAEPTAPFAGPGGLVTSTPVRALDTRETGRCVDGNGQTIRIAARNSVPSTASAVALNVTVTGPGAPGYLTVWPAGQPRPTASNLNFTAGQTIANMVTAKLGAGGSINLVTNQGCPQVIVDIAGYYVGGSAGKGGFVGITPDRVLDTRTDGPCVSATPRRLTVAGVGAVPSGAAAVVLNVTVTEPSADGYLTLWPTGAARPTASNLNFTAGQTVPNMATVKVGAGGTIDLVSNQGCPQVIVDIAGYSKGGTPVVAGGFVGLTPARVIDTRTTGPCVGSAGRTVTIAGRVGVPQSTDPGGARSVALNVTVTGGSGDGFLTVWPSGRPRPTASNINFTAGQTIANMVVVGLGAGGSIQVMTNQGCPDVIIDVAGYFRSAVD